MKDRSGAYEFPWYGNRSAIVAHEDSHSRDYLKEALARAGYTADVRGDTRYILDHGHTDRHSFLILRSGTSGMEALRSLRKQGNPIPVIFLSEATLEQPCPLDSSLGIVGRLSAPFTLKTLRVAIAEVCQDESGEPEAETPLE